MPSAKPRVFNSFCCWCQQNSHFVLGVTVGHENIPPFVALDAMICASECGCSIPLGTVIPYAGEAIVNSDWMILNGSSINPVAYPTQSPSSLLFVVQFFFNFN